MVMVDTEQRLERNLELAGRGLGAEATLRAATGAPPRTANSQVSPMRTVSGLADSGRGQSGENQRWDKVGK